MNPDVVEMRELLTGMIRARVFTQRAFNLQRQGRAGTVAPLTGEEAVVVGAAAALDPEVDFVFPQYREHAGLERFGEEVFRKYILAVRGHPDGGRFDTARVHPIQIALAAQIPHAVGMAWGFQRLGHPGVALVFFGDGASSEGDFYEAGNLAGVLRAPVVFLCVNNGWAISTPRSRQTAAASFADKAAGFGFPGVEVDGNDVVAVREAVRAARDRALAGNGPTLIEAQTYRLGPHTTSDDPTRYVPPEELAAAQRRDPISRLAHDLEVLGAWSAADTTAAEDAATQRANDVIDWSDTVALEPDAFFDHVFAEPTPRMERQRDELLAHLREVG